MKGRVCIAGFATWHVAQSAFRAGYEVWSIDHFCDQDLSWYTRGCRTFEELSELPDLIAELAVERHFDFLVVTSGAERIDTTLPLCGTDQKTVGEFLDKLEIQRFFEKQEIPVPPLVEGEYPCMIKPRTGAGGWRNQVVADEGGRFAWEELWPDVPYLCQRIVEGVAASVSCIANGRDAMAIAVNRQFLRGGEGEKSYGFAGVVTPLEHPLAGEMARLAERAAAASGCVGSVGIDFVLGAQPWAIEINPRFQATLDVVEMATGCNLFELHVRGCNGMLPQRRPEPGRIAMRRILFADRDLIVRDDLKHLAPAIADIPWLGTEIEEGSAILSVYGWGETREQASVRLDNTITTLRRYMTRW